MDSKRRVDFQILFDLLKGKKGLSFIGIIFTFLSLFVFIPLIIILSATLKEPYEKYDFKKITEKGIEKSAKITTVTTVNNVNINGRHPEVIGYEFENNGQRILDKFQTLDLEKVADFTAGTEIPVLFYQNQSIIKDLKPFTFPVYLFYLLPGIFLLVGVPFLFIGFIPALKTFNLYKTGIVKEAYVVSMDAVAGMFTRGFVQDILVNYYYLDEFRNRIFGKSTTTDLLILNEKKAGDIIKVFVSEKDETKSCLIPKLEAVKYNWEV